MNRYISIARMNGLRLVCLSIIFLSITAMFLSAEEKYVPKPYLLECEKTYMELPDWPSEEEFSAFRQHVESRIRICITERQTVLFKGSANKLIVALFGEEVFSERFGREELLLAAPKALSKNGKTRYAPTKKWLLLMFSLARIALEGRATPDCIVNEFPEERKLLSLKLVYLVSNLMILMQQPAIRAYHELDPLYDEEKTRFNRETGLLDWFRQKVCDEFARLEIPGDTTIEKLRNWYTQIDEAQKEYSVGYCALMSWFFLNIRPEHVLKSDKFTLPPTFDEGIKSLVQHLGNPEIFDEFLPFFLPSGGCMNTELAKFHAFFMQSFLFVSMMDDYLGCNRILSGPAHFNQGSISMVSPIFDLFLTPDALKVSQPLFRKLKDYRRIRWLPSNARFKLIDEGKSGESWFCGNIRDFSKIAGKISEDFVFPQYHFVMNDIGETVMSIMTFHIQEELGLSEHFEWQLVYYGKYSPPRYLKSYPINREIEAVRFPEDIEKIVSDGWRERFFEGLGGVNPHMGNDGIAKSFLPAVYYRYKNTRWRMYVMSEYRPDFDLFWFDQPICVLEVYPEPNEEPEEVKFGLLFGELDEWFYRTGYPNGIRTMWNSYEYRNALANTQVFAQAMEICDKAGENREERYKEARKKLMELYRRGEKKQE